MRNYFPSTQTNSCPDLKFMKHFTVRIQSKIKKIRHNPDPVKSKSSPMLICATEVGSSELLNSELLERANFSGTIA